MVFDYVIIGAGAAGLQMALAMSKDPYFNNKEIGIFEPNPKIANDKTWCYWEKGNGDYDEIISGQWEKALFFGGKKSLELDLGDYSYKMLRSEDFYQFAKNQIASKANIHWIAEEVISIDETDPMVSIFADNKYWAQYVFDSRLSASSEELKKSNGVLQHFLGWEIESEEDSFATDSFTMMDYRLKWPGTTSFMYVLPQSKKKALIEFTYFSADLVPDEHYEQMLKKYLKEILDIKKYTIRSVEKGVIPMYDYPFHKANKEQIIKIGTAGGWVKASSGYSFKSAAKKCLLIIENIKLHTPLTQGLRKKRHEIYDATFLKVLEKENHLGEDMFTTMYAENNIETVFDFLNEETSLAQEIGIMNTFPKIKFGKAMLSVLFNKQN